MAYFGVDLDVRVKEVNLQFKNILRSRGGIGIRSLGTIFKQMDENGNKRLDIGEFEQALNTFGLFLKKTDLQALMKYYDVDGDGNVSYDEFLRGLRDDLNDRKRAMVEKAYSLLDRQDRGFITAKDIIKVYDVSKEKAFIDGTMTKEQIIGQFLDSFEGLKGNRDGVLTKNEFFDYYTDLAMSTPSDEYFVQMMESAWCVAEDEENAVFKDRIKHLIGLMRQRLLVISNSSAEEFVLRKIFKEFDINGNGSITIDEMLAMLAKLGISVERKYINAMMKTLDTNKTGTLEFEEFATFLLYDPYK